ncbi:TetR/AcrR family transcriptional regulator [Herbiconiux sp.]|uniref:TetR/AcrR family transcriptional regulator n=1 Tax=Herbiconiux sp. TaxID=1871186 RepID=UPI0025C464BB|nr:TetR/AcrR family transcriptional regulator [Herbiconiux sp.]
MSERTARAPALPVEDRRRAIVAAVIPLLLERGADVTSRQLADAAGVAEGTIFRAFGDKESVIAAAAEMYFDPDTARNALRAIDPDDPFETKLAQVIDRVRERVTGTMRMMAALGRRLPPPHSARGDTGEIIGRVFAAELPRLGLSAERLEHLVRVVAFGSAIPPVARVDDPLTSEELAHILAHGLLDPQEGGSR